MKSEWTKETVRELLLRNDRAVERGVMSIYAKQTEDEKSSEHTKHHNNVGFSGCHGHMGSYYAKWLMSGRHLNGAHLVKARKMMLKYSGQLVKIIEGKI